MRDDQNEHAHRHGENQSADIYKKSQIRMGDPKSQKNVCIST